ncbi:MAG: GNAT family N-acetyltransferase [Blastocatellia bacterium]|nr:GNAT family N-acetyltransferase [Blastocatellia bacterium]
MRPVSKISSLGDSEKADSLTKPDPHARRVGQSLRMSVKVINDFADLEEHLQAWEELALTALEPNPFYESWMLMPALRSFGRDKDLQIVLVFASDEAQPSRPPVLCGLFPLERRSRYKGIPVKALSLWKHLFCFLSTPLIRADCAEQSLSAFFDWLASDSNPCPLMEFNFIAGEGPFQRLLVSRFHDHSSLTYISECYARAMFRPATDADTYLRRAVSRGHRKDLNRKQRRLSETGRFEYTTLELDEDPGICIEEFLRVESSGWKGAEGSALASKEEYRKFFIDAARGAHSRGRLMILASRVDGRPVAMKCNFLAGRGSFAFKIAFDEDYAHFSPGILLEIENIRRLHSIPDVEWMDSCAVPDHIMINRLWPDRRIIQTVLVSAGKRPGDLVVSAMPLLRWLKRLFAGERREGSRGAGERGSRGEKY